MSYGFDSSLIFLLGVTFFVVAVVADVVDVITAAVVSIFRVLRAFCFVSRVFLR